MARVELVKGETPALMRLAEAIADGQSREIDAMSTWRVEWLGKQSPAGGVPIEDSGAHSDHGM
jgi:uncharacterized protein (DUF305 family)